MLSRQNIFNKKKDLDTAAGENSAESLKKPDSASR